MSYEIRHDYIEKKSRLIPAAFLLIGCGLVLLGRPGNFLSLSAEARLQLFCNLNSTKMSKMLTAYCMKTKEKDVPMQDAVITKTARGGYMAQGHDGKGNKMTTMLAEAKALQAVKDGVAKKAW
jgi:hypothetical protein